MTSLRVVIDTNVLISGLLSSTSTSHKVFDFVTAQQTLLISDSTFEEIAQTLTRNKFNRYLSLDKRLNFIAGLRNKAEIVKILEVIQICRDPKDNQFLEVAVNGNATHLVTGDNDLLILHPFRSIQILTPSQFLNLFPSTP